MSIEGSSSWSRFRKSTRSDAGNGCVEVSFGPEGRVRVRDSKRGDDSAVLEFAAFSWIAFLSGRPSSVHVVRTAAGGAHMLNAALGFASPVLVFNLEEWLAFEGGVTDGEFMPRLIPAHV